MVVAGPPGACRILEHPVELIELIELMLTRGDRTDILNTRATCRDLEAKSRAMLIDNFFRDRTFILADRTSISRLLGISKHPVFSKTMQSIIFTVEQLRPLDRRWHQSTTAGSVDLSTTPREKRIMLRETAKVIASPKDEAKRCQHEVETQLTAMFTNFLHAACVLAIFAVHDCNMESTGRRCGVYGLSRRGGLSEYPKPVAGSTLLHPGYACNIILGTLIRSGYPPEVVELGSIYISNLRFDDNVFVASRLRRLVLDIDCTARFGSSNEDETNTMQTDMATLSRLLLTATELRDLALETHIDPGAQRRGAILNSILGIPNTALMRLECLIIDHLILNQPSALEDCAKVRRQTLRVVKVGSWEPRRDSQMEDINLRVLFGVPRKRIWKFAFTRNEAELRGGIEEKCSLAFVEFVLVRRTWARL
ncbi:hypothetical protein CLAFUR4_07621 [Fulvia fulva]|nr:hypothetical protein CLAFUR4_07621 [Fulvia fulva]